ncbi:patatin-like phospholipase family protein [Taibaiella koreensis]|uniref:patatin-like phospholipase family protein n=1 Tax=Taibaiella koreensis TaxID=1268548 RepID=UPI000E59A81C|nr:patatin-like phospholipase family protein [Taibaiella koreensis]
MSTALVISGGGSKGAFAVGAIKTMFRQRPGLAFDMLIGTSTGALIAPLATARDIALLEQLYTSVTTEQVITTYNVGNRILTADSIFGVEPLAQLLKQYYTDTFFNDLATRPYNVLLATTCLQTEAAVYFASKTLNSATQHEVIALKQADHFRRAVLASACQPVFMTPIEVIPGAQPLRQYVDGGVREYAGIQLAIEQGADEVFVILLSPEITPPVEKRYTGVPDILMRTIEIFSEDVGDNDLQIPLLYNKALGYMDTVRQNLSAYGIPEDKITALLNVPGSPFSNKRSVNLHLIRPDGYLGGGPGGLTFDPAEMKGMVAKGERTMNQYIAGLAPGSSILV